MTKNEWRSGVVPNCSDTKFTASTVQHKKRKRLMEISWRVLTLENQLPNLGPIVGIKIFTKTGEKQLSNFHIIK